MANPRNKKATDEVEVELVTEETAEVVEAVPVVEEAVPVVAEKAEAFPYTVIEGQLGIYENRVVNVPEDVKVVEVENVDGGDIYVDNIGIQYGPNYLLAPGKVKVYKGAKNVFLSSASRPNFIIRFYKG